MAVTSIVVVATPGPQGAPGSAGDVAVVAHEADTTNIHGIVDTTVLETTTGATAKVTAHAAAADPHPVYLTTAEGNTAYQGLDSDLTALAGIAPANDDLVQRKAGAWTNRTPAQVKTDLVLAKGDVGLGNVDNVSDVNKPVSTAQAAADATKQPLDADLTTIAGLTATTDTFIQSKASAWASRTPAQVAADLVTPLSLSLQPLDSDLTAIAGLTATTDNVIQSVASGWASRTPTQVKTTLALAKADVGLGAVDNVADVSKPVSTTQAASIATKVGLTGAETVAGVKTFSSEPVAPSIKVTGVTGAPNTGRFVGVTTSGAPTTGTFSVGDFVLTQNGNQFVCILAGTPGTWVNPVDTGRLLLTGEEVASRDVMSAVNIATTTQALRLSYFTARKTETTTQVRVITGTTAAAATPTLCRIGLYELAANGDATLVASTANDTTLFAAASTVYTRSWSASCAKTAGTRYALAILVVTAVATPVFVGTTLASAGATELALAPRLSGFISSQADLPSTFLESAVSATTTRNYGVILP